MDVVPKQKTTPRQKIAQLVRLLGTTARGERVSAWHALERTMDGAGVDWNDLGNWLERDGELERDEGKYTESEMQEFAQAARAEGVEAGIKIGMARASHGGGNGHVILPKPLDIAEYCHQRLSRMKDDTQRNFINEMYAKTRRGMNIQAGTLGYLVSLYMKHGGKYQC